MLKYLLLILIAAASLGRLAVPASADTTVPVNPSIRWGTWEGWGCSLAWWANVYGRRDDLADIVFTTKQTTLNGQTLPGLGMTIARYNAGACSPRVADGAVMSVSPRIPAFRQIDCFWTDGQNADPLSSSWNWAADSNQRTMLQKAKERGADRFELFANSPPWWMCVNHNPSGADDGAKDNLKPQRSLQYAAYLATVAGYAANHWGIQFESVEPFNEPITTWWYSKGNQEGCHFDAATQASVIDALRAEMDARGQEKTLVAASDENAYDGAAQTWKSLSPAAQASVGRVNVHGYQYGGGHRALLRSAVSGHRLWNSEYGEGDASGLPLADNLSLDLHELHPTAWCYWQPLDGHGWGLIQADLKTQQIGSVNPKYFVLAQFTRHIRPGMTLIDSGDPTTVAAYDPAHQKLVLVTTNHATPRRLRFDLSRFAAVSGPITRWATQAGPAGEKYAVHQDIHLAGKAFTVDFSPNTVQTFEIANVH